MMSLLHIRPALSFLTGFLLVLAPSFGWAHHGWAGYNRDVDASLVVTELRLGNAHDQLVATDAEGQVWDLVLATPNRNRRLGFDEDSRAVKAARKNVQQAGLQKFVRIAN